MNLLDYIPGIAIFVIGFAFGAAVINMIRNHVTKYDPLIPKIPHVRVGTPVFIGEDMYYLAAYHYEEDGLNTQGKRTAIFQSVPTKEKNNYE